MYTKVPSTVRGLIKQRTRWTSGFLRNVAFDYQDLVGNPKYGILGLVVLPLGFMAIIGGLVAFGLILYIAVKNVIDAYLLHSGVPLSYTISRATHVDWFNLPITELTLLALVAGGGIILFIYIGKKVSHTPARLVPGILAYLLIYQLIAPFWLFKSVRDVALGKRRPWR